MNVVSHIAAEMSHRISPVDQSSLQGSQMSEDGWEIGWRARITQYSWAGETNPIKDSSKAVVY